MKAFDLMNMFRCVQSSLCVLNAHADMSCTPHDSHDPSDAFRDQSDTRQPPEIGSTCLSVDSCGLSHASQSDEWSKNSSFRCRESEKQEVACTIMPP